MPVDIRPYAAGDEAGLLAVWTEAMWADPIDAVTWRGRYLLDPAFRARTCPVAVDRHTGEFVGFLLGFTRDTAADAWVVAFGVAPQRRREGIGTALLQAFATAARDAGANRIRFGPYVPSYLTPGVDVHAYPEAVAFLTARGADAGDRPLSMKANLTGYRPAPGTAAREQQLAEAVITVRAAVAADILPLLAFLAAHFPHWRDDALGVMRDLFGGDPRGVTLHLALDGETIIGYAQTRAERFGPFGVDAAYRGRGIGGVLLSRALRAMRAQGVHSAWFLWTSDRTATLYRQHGFEEARRFVMLTQPLDPR